MIAIDVTDNEEGICVIEINCYEIVPIDAQSLATDNTTADKGTMILGRAKKV